MLREYAKVAGGDFDIVEFDGFALHLTASDLAASLEYEEAKTEAFTLTGHFVRDHFDSVWYGAAPYHTESKWPRPAAAVVRSLGLELVIGQTSPCRGVIWGRPTLVQR